MSDDPDNNTESERQFRLEMLRLAVALVGVDKYKNASLRELLEEFEDYVLAGKFRDEPDAKFVVDAERFNDVWSNWRKWST